MLSAEAMAAIARANARGGPAPLSASGFAALLSRDTTLVVCRPEGFALLIVAGAEADVHSVEVTPAAQGRGVGTALMHEALGRARDIGVRDVFLEVATENAVARRLYERVGFKSVGRRKAYYRHADGTRGDAAIMALCLATSPACPADRQSDLS